MGGRGGLLGGGGGGGERRGDDMNTETAVMTYPWSLVSVCRYSLLVTNQ